MDKPKKPQGKLDYGKIMKGMNLGMKKKDLATYAGSLAKSDSAKAVSVTRVLKSDKFQAMMGEKVRMANDHLTEEKLERTNAVGLSNIIDKLSKVGGIALQGTGDQNNVTNVDTQNILIQYLKGDTAKE